VRVYAFISDQQTEFPVETLCRVAGVAKSAYYDWEARGAAGPSPAVAEEAKVLELIRGAHKGSNGAYGEPRITEELARAGLVVNHKRVERLMRRHGIRGKCGRKRVRTTVQDPNAEKAPDLVERHFEQLELDVLWVGDITYIPTGQGFLYLSSVLDCCSRRLLGWSIAEHMRAELCVDALHAAVATRGGPRVFDDLVFHSDKGTQYTSAEYRQACQALGISQAMGSVGDSFDNALAESFWASLKRECPGFGSFATKAEARRAVFRWLVWYNERRLHTSIGKKPPVEYEQNLYIKQHGGRCGAEGTVAA